MKAVFLDRDGVVNEAIVINGKPYPPSNLNDFNFIKGIENAIKILKSIGYYIFIVTNQPDVSRGKVLMEEVNEINNYILNSTCVDKIYTCFHDDKNNCDCRKPKPGMLIQAQKDWDIDFSKSFLIGDRWRDIEAGISAGVKTIFIDYDYEELKVKSDYVCKSSIEAIEIILKLNNKKNESN